MLFHVASRTRPTAEGIPSPFRAGAIGHDRAVTSRQANRISDGAEALWATLAAEQPAAAEHARRVSAVAARLANELGLTPDQRATLASAARFHDIGECLLPPGLVGRAVAYSEAEREAMQSHPELGANALAHAGMPAEVVEAVRSHHERWDGSGYPQRLTGEAIPLAARVLHVCEAWDAMRRHRLWADLITPDEALDEIRSGAGSQFDPEVAQVAGRCLAGS
jgi:putative nucleotidyltransferase with HDIG domain